MKGSVVIKGNKYGIVVVLDENKPFELLKEEIAEKFRESSKFFGDVKMAASFEGRKLSEDEEREVLEIISENSDMKIVCVVDTDEAREKAFKKSLDEKLNELSTQSGQFYKGTLRSGQVLESDNSIVILGDVNPGAKIISKGNVIVLGSLKGTVYAGATGNHASFVVALEMNPMQIRIGDIIARSGDNKKKVVEKEAKIAFVDDGYIYIEALNRDAIKYIN